MDQKIIDKIQNSRLKRTQWLPNLHDLHCRKQLEAVNQAMLDQLASQDQEFRQFLKDIKEKMNDPA